METNEPQKNIETKKESARSRPASNGMDIKVYNQKGKETGTATLPETVFGAPWNADLVHQVVTSLTANKRAGTAHTKTRGEVRGGGKKPWKQKGTGQARHGSTRSPIWVGGGIAHGPRNDKNYKVKINRKMMAKALYTTLSEKLRNNELIVLDSLALAGGKAKEGKDVLNALSAITGLDRLARSKKGVFIAGFGLDAMTKRGFRNFGNILVGDVRTMTPLDALNYTYVVMVTPESSVAFLEKKLSGGKDMQVAGEKKQEKPKAVKKPRAAKKTAKK